MARPRKSRRLCGSATVSSVYNILFSQRHYLVTSTPRTNRRFGPFLDLPTRFLRPRGGKLAPTARPRATWFVKFLPAVDATHRFDGSNLGRVSCRTTSRFWFPLLSPLHCPQSLVPPWLRSSKESLPWGSYAKDRPSSSMTARVQPARSRRLPVAITLVLAGPSTFCVHIGAFRDNGSRTMVRWSVARLPKRVIFDRSNRSKTSPGYPQLQTNCCVALSDVVGQQSTSGRSSRVGVTQISWSPMLIDASADRHFDPDMAW